MSQIFAPKRLHQHVRGHFENGVRDEEDPGAEPERCGGQPDVRAELVLGEVEIHAVHVVRDEHHEGERDDAPEDLTDGGLNGGRVLNSGDLCWWYCGHERLVGREGREG
ncbi:hypothetical protein OHA59_44920 [Streptomyces sp. NBC_01589]